MWVDPHTSVLVIRMHLTDTLFALCHSSLTDLSNSSPSLSEILFASFSIWRAAASRSCLISCKNTSGWLLHHSHCHTGHVTATHRKHASHAPTLAAPHEGTAVST